MPIKIPSDFWYPDAVSEAQGLAILPPFADNTLLKCQRRLGVTLPGSLVELLRTKNGGQIRYPELQCEHPTLWGDSKITINSIPGITAEEVRHGGLLNYELDFEYAHDPGDVQRKALLKKVGMAHLLIPISRDAHSMVALDYRGCPHSGNPPISWMTFDEDCDSVQIVSSFDNLLKRLRKSDDD